MVNTRWLHNVGDPINVLIQLRLHNVLNPRPLITGSHDWGLFYMIPALEGIPNNKPRLGMFYYWWYENHSIC